MTEKLLTVKEAAEIFRLKHPGTIRDWIKSGKLAATRPGGGRSPWLIPQSAVDRLIAGG